MTSSIRSVQDEVTNKESLFQTSRKFSFNITNCSWIFKLYRNEWKSVAAWKVSKTHLIISNTIYGPVVSKVVEFLCRMEEQTVGQPAGALAKSVFQI